MNKKDFFKINFEQDADDGYVCKPNFNFFYSWLGNGAPLRLNIPDTIVSGTSNDTIRYLYTNEEGYIESYYPKLETQEDKDKFVMFCHSRFIHSLELQQELLTSSERNNRNNILLNNILAIQKRSIQKTYNSTTTLQLNNEKNNAKPQPNYLRPKSAPSIRSTSSLLSTNLFNKEQKKSSNSTEGKIESHQHCEVLLPIAFHSQLLEMNDNNLSYPIIIQKYIKSRGKIPSVYRLLWKASGESSGNVEGYIVSKVNKKKNEFIQPNIIYRSEKEIMKDSHLFCDNNKENSLHDENQFHGRNHQDNSNKEKDDYSFKKNTTKFVSNFLRLTELNELKEVEEEERRRKELNQFILKSSSQDSLYHEDSLQDSNLFLTKLIDDGGNNGSNKDKLKNEENFTTQFIRDVDYIDRTNEEIDKLFLDSLEAQLHLSTIDRSESMQINTRLNLSLLDNTCLNISTLEDNSPSVLTTQSVLPQALSNPHEFLSNLSRWLSNWLHTTQGLSKVAETFAQDNNFGGSNGSSGGSGGNDLAPPSNQTSNPFGNILNLNSNYIITSIVADFIKDDNGKWHFFHLHRFNFIKKNKLILTKMINNNIICNTRKDRLIKQENERGTLCKLCGVYYLDNSTIELSLEDSLMLQKEQQVVSGMIGYVSNLKMDVKLEESTEFDSASHHENFSISPSVSASQTLNNHSQRGGLSGSNQNSSDSATQSHIASIPPPNTTAPSITHVPAYGYHITNYGAQQVAQTYSRAGMTLSSYSALMINHNISNEIDYRSILMEKKVVGGVPSYSLPFNLSSQYLIDESTSNGVIGGELPYTSGKQGGVKVGTKPSVLKNTEALICCFYCHRIYSKLTLLKDAAKTLHDKLNFVYKDKHSILNQTSSPSVVFSSPSPSPSSVKFFDSPQFDALGNLIVKNKGQTRPSSALKSRPSSATSINFAITPQQKLKRFLKMLTDNLKKKASAAAASSSSSRPSSPSPSSFSPAITSSSIFNNSSPLVSLDNTPTKSVPRPKSASSYLSRSQKLFPVSSTGIKLESTLELNEKEKKIAENPSNLAYLQGKFCAFHSIPRKALHWRLFLMTHFVIQEKSQETSSSLDASSFCCLQYTLGQGEFSLPFPTKLEPFTQSNKKVVNGWDYSPAVLEQLGEYLTMTSDYPTLNNGSSNTSIKVIPIQQVRIHSFCATESDTLLYLKEKLINMKLYSYNEKEDLPHLEGEFDLSLASLSQKFDKESLSKGFIKNEYFSTLSKINSSSKSYRILLKVSIAIIQDHYLPSELSNRDYGDFYVEPLNYEPKDHIKTSNNTTEFLSKSIDTFNGYDKISSRPQSAYSSRNTSAVITTDRPRSANLNSTYKNIEKANESMNLSRTIVPCEIFWPPQEYTPFDLPLPSPWIAMLTRLPNEEKILKSMIKTAKLSKSLQSSTMTPSSVSAKLQAKIHPTLLNIATQKNVDLKNNFNHLDDLVIEDNDDGDADVDFVNTNSNNIVKDEFNAALEENETFESILNEELKNERERIRQQRLKNSAQQPLVPNRSHRAALVNNQSLINNNNLFQNFKRSTKLSSLVSGLSDPTSNSTSSFEGINASILRETVVLNKTLNSISRTSATGSTLTIPNRSVSPSLLSTSNRSSSPSITSTSNRSSSPSLHSSPNRSTNLSILSTSTSKKESILSKQSVVSFDSRDKSIASISSNSFLSENSIRNVSKSILAHEQSKLERQEVRKSFFKPKIMANNLLDSSQSGLSLKGKRTETLEKLYKEILDEYDENYIEEDDEDDEEDSLAREEKKKIINEINHQNELKKKIRNNIEDAIELILEIFEERYDYEEKCSLIIQKKANDDEDNEERKEIHQKLIQNNNSNQTESQQLFHNLFKKSVEDDEEEEEDDEDDEDEDEDEEYDDFDIDSSIDHKPIVLSLTLINEYINIIQLITQAYSNYKNIVEEEIKLHPFNNIEDENVVGNIKKKSTFIIPTQASSTSNGDPSSSSSISSSVLPSSLFSFQKKKKNVYEFPPPPELELTSNEFEIISEEVLEAVMYTLRHIKMLDFLPSKINFIMFKPLFFEHLKVFLTY